MSFIPLTNIATFKFHGADTERYLNGQVTQNVSKATHTEAISTCITNAKGKLDGFGYLRRQDDHILLDIPLALRESLYLRLDKYIIADDVTLEDVTDDYTWYHVLDPNPATASWTCNRFGTKGYDTLNTPIGTELTTSELEKLRIINCIPQWGAELNEDILPPEALLEEKAISYHKGCYIGQEVISRIRSAGKINKRLTGFELTTSLELPFHIPNPQDPEGKPAGIITSSTPTENGFLGLGYLNKKWFNHTAFKSDTITLKVRQ